MKNVEQIKVNKIIPNKSQPRLDFYEESLEGLAESIKENGLLQPISVRRNGSKYEIIAGERRFRACLMLGYDTIDAIVYDKNDDESANLALIENIQREDLNSIEQALAMQKLMKMNNLTQNELAEKLGYQQSTVANKIRLLKLPNYVKTAITKGVITERHARALLNVPKERLDAIFKTIVDRKYNVAKTEEYIRESINRKKSRGVGGSAKIAINTIKQAYDLCRKSGIDADFSTTDYSDNLKITIKIKK